MSLLGKINNIPLYTTMEEAEMWGKQYDLTGSHTHLFKRVKGYMAGTNNSRTNTAFEKGIVSPLKPSELNKGKFITTIEERNFYRAISKKRYIPRKTPTRKSIPLKHFVRQPQQKPVQTRSQTSSTSSRGSGGY